MLDSHNNVPERLRTCINSQKSKIWTTSQILNKTKLDTEVFEMFIHSILTILFVICKVSVNIKWPSSKEVRWFYTWGHQVFLKDACIYAYHVRHSMKAFRGSAFPCDLKSPSIPHKRPTPLWIITWGFMKILPYITRGIF